MDHQLCQCVWEAPQSWLQPVHLHSPHATSACRSRPRQGENGQNVQELGHRSEIRRERPDRSGPHEGRHGQVPACRRVAAQHDHSVAAFPRSRSEVPRGDAVRRPTGRRVRERHPHLRPERPADDVRVQDGPHIRPWALLRVRACLLGHHPNWNEGPYHGPQLPPRQEGRPVREEHPAHCDYDGSVRGAGGGYSVRQHVRAGGHGPVPRQVGNHLRLRGRPQHPCHEVQRVPRRASCRRAQAPQRPAQARGRPQAPQQVGSVRAVLHRGVWRAHRGWRW
mmetsp:Transcript_8349/g.14303  ORF Transcript_8349/g.14303 Transcript_8349/m.14303 type:complete len:279 (+) Transcript_8349:825-1661(+)